MARRSHRLRERFLFSTEEECLTGLPDDRDRTNVAIGRFSAITRRLAPSILGPSGHFNGYGRTYADMGHIELAAMECDNPYLLAEVVEKQHAISAQAVAEMEKEGFQFVLANNNHSGLLQVNCPVWGAHENYLTEKHPSEFTELVLPFLVTRIYAGAGGIQFPTGDYLAGVRPTRMDRLDWSWLAARLDTFAKYEVYSNVLHHAASSWKDLSKNTTLFHRLALLDHSYHEFCNRSSLFRQMENAGVLDHRVCPIENPGAESEPFVVDTSTRARARAQLISSHCNESQWVVDWSCLHDITNNRRRALNEPFAESYGPWCEFDSRMRSRESLRARLRRLAEL